MKPQYDYTAYRGGAATPESMTPDRPSTVYELAAWMNNMASSVSSGVYHWVTEKVIHWANQSINEDTGERTIHDWGIL